VVTREDLIAQSVFDYAKEGLRARGYDEGRVAFIEAWSQIAEPLEKNYVATGFDFDDEGEQAEMGSDLKRRLYTIQFFVFGQTLTLSRNIANALKFVLEREGTIPLLQVDQAGRPEIDKLILDGVSAERQVVPDPQPWQRFVYTTTLRVEDCYFAALI
jgi:hypothetical protein